MIITRSPLRISFAGGGTDIPEFYRNYGPGVVVSTSINRHVYVTVNKKFDGKVSVRYRVHEIVDRADEIMHPLIREILKDYGIEKGIEIVIISEVPARGSGLGASSALAVALCLALEYYTGNMSWKSEVNFSTRNYIAERAASIEINKCGSPIGKQDHYASAMGGLNLLKFNQDETVEVINYDHDDEFIEELEDQSMLFYLNMEHEYHQESGFVHKILKDQLNEIHEKKNIHKIQRDNAIRLWEHMAYSVPERFMDHINENWRLKRSVHGSITNEKIDEIIARAYQSGATASKVCGAGGGGFLYLMVPISMQDDVRRSLYELHELDFQFDKSGVQSVFQEKHVLIND